jgi:hypothetical protein
MNKKQVNFEQQKVEFMAGTTATDKNDLLDHRVATFEELGFSKEDSENLAAAKHRDVINGKGYDFSLSWHKVKKMLDAGCTHELALKILL